MGQGSKFDSALSTRGGKSNFVTSNDIFYGDKLAKKILAEMEKEGIKFSKDKIVFAARLTNGNKIFLENGAVDHIMSRHSAQFENTFGTKSRSDVIKLLGEAVSKGVLVKATVKVVNGRSCYSNKYYYKGQYTIVYGIANNGYIETAYPKKFGGKK